MHHDLEKICRNLFLSKWTIYYLIRIDCCHIIRTMNTIFFLYFRRPVFLKVRLPYVIASNTSLDFTQKLLVKKYLNIMERSEYLTCLSVHRSWNYEKLHTNFVGGLCVLQIS